MLTRQQHRFAIDELAKELHEISQDIKKNKIIDIKLQVWKDYFWDDIFFYYLFNYDKISDFEYDKKYHEGGDIIDLDENVAESIWLIILRVCQDIVYDIRHYKPSTCINAVHKMFVKTFEVYLRQYDMKNIFITIQEIC